MVSRTGWRISISTLLGCSHRIPDIHGLPTLVTNTYYSTLRKLMVQSVHIISPVSRDSFYDKAKSLKLNWWKVWSNLIPSSELCRSWLARQMRTDIRLRQLIVQRLLLLCLLFFSPSDGETWQIQLIYHLAALRHILCQIIVFFGGRQN